ncbi:MAG TPA: hypothetical protein VFM82_12365 [Flavobacteriaceae bacterium]|nr:hypothetical protein [Flavobacteriaceae bacterium]
MNTKLDEIYEPHDGIYVINNENANGEYSGSQNHCHNMPKYVFEVMQKYIEKLESEIEILKQRK